MRNFKYRIYPNKTVKKALGDIFFGHHCLYNKALEQRINAYKNYGLSLTAFDQSKSLNQVRKTKYPQVNCTSFQQTMRRLDLAFKAFFRRVKAGQKPGFPRFKPTSRFNNIVFRNGDGARIANGKLILTKLLPIRIKWHRELPENSTIKQIRIITKNGKWYVCLSVDADFSVDRERTGSVIGIDLGISHLATTSDGTFYDSPKYYINSQKKLRVLQRSVSRKKKGSNSRRNAVKALAKFHEHISEQRNDFLHKLTSNLVKKHDAIVLEDLKLAFMNRNKHLAKSSLDVAMGSFVEKLTYKAESAGVPVIKVNPKYTSQACSRCGRIVKKSLSVRTHKCDCGLILDRDVNAARNILQRGASLLGDITWADVRPCVSSQAVCFS